MTGRRSCTHSRLCELSDAKIRMTGRRSCTRLLLCDLGYAKIRVTGRRSCSRLFLRDLGYAKICRVGYLDFLCVSAMFNPHSFGEVPEWLKGADCKSAGSGLRWFESTPHQSFSSSAPKIID